MSTQTRTRTVTMPATVAARLGPVVTALAYRPGGTWDVTAHGIHPGTTDQTVALTALAYQAYLHQAALYFPTGTYYIAHWQQLGWWVGGQRVMVSQRWIGEAGAILWAQDTLVKSEVQWHGARFSGLTFTAPYDRGEKFFGAGSRNLLFETCTVQNCAPDFLDGGDAWITFWNVLFTSTPAYTDGRTPKGFGPCTGQIQQTIGNVGEHFTVDSCSFQFAPHGKSGSLISLEGSGLVGDYLINNNRLLTDARPDYLLDAGIDVEPHQRTPVTDVTITNNILSNTRIYIAGVTTATIRNNTINMTHVGMDPAPYHPPFCGNASTGKYRGKTTEPALGPAILGFSSYGIDKQPPSGTILIEANTIRYGTTINAPNAPAVPFSFGHGGSIGLLRIRGNTITQAHGAGQMIDLGATIPPVIAYLSPAGAPKGWGAIEFTNNTVYWSAAANAPLVQVNLANGANTAVTITGNHVQARPGERLATFIAGYGKNTKRGAHADTDVVRDNTPAAANRTIRTYLPFTAIPPGVGAVTPGFSPPAWYANRWLWAGVGAAGVAGYGAWAWHQHRWPFPEPMRTGADSIPIRIASPPSP